MRRPLAVYNIERQIYGNIIYYDMPARILHFLSSRQPSISSLHCTISVSTSKGYTASWRERWYARATASAEMSSMPRQTAVPSATILRVSLT